MSRPEAGAMAPKPAWSRPSYRTLLGWAFTVFNSVRLLSYLPTMWAIAQQGDSSQHSLLTWGTWFGANLTMAAWLHETGTRRIDGPVLVNLGNAAACGLTMALIAVMRS